MPNVQWDLGGFNVFYAGKYRDINDVERDSASLRGISNFSGFEEDWLLIEKDKNEIGFMIFDIPSVISKGDAEEIVESAEAISFDDFFAANGLVFVGSRAAYYSKLKDYLCVADLSDVRHKVSIGHSFYLLLDSKKRRCGFVLRDAAKNIAAENDEFDHVAFNHCLEIMLELCDEKAYEVMDKKDGVYLQNLVNLDKLCATIKDGRVFHIRKFVENAKYTFYDIGP